VIVVDGKTAEFPLGLAADGAYAALGEQKSIEFLNVHIITPFEVGF